MPRVLVTGATGFVGWNLTEHLRRRDWDVRCLVRDKSRAAGLENLGAELTLGSLGDRESLLAATKGVEVVFHVAGRVRALKEQAFRQDNVEGTRNVVEACTRQSQPPVTLMVSSLAAGGPSQAGTPRRETDRDEPISVYGRSKLAAEQTAAEFAGEMPLSIIRPPIIFGPADKASLTIFRMAQRMHLHVSPGYRKFMVSIVHVADLCDAMVLIVEQGTRVVSGKDGDRDASVGKYYIAGERSISYHEFGKLAGAAVDSKVLAISAPKFLFWMIGGACEAFGQVLRHPLVLNLDKIREAVAPGWECSDEKLRQELGYRSEPLEERFAETAAWYQAQGWI